MASIKAFVKRRADHSHHRKHSPATVHAVWRRYIHEKVLGYSRHRGDWIKATAANTGLSANAVEHILGYYPCEGCFPR